MSHRVNIYDKIIELCSLYQQILKGELIENEKQFYQDHFFNMIFPNLLSLYQSQQKSIELEILFKEKKSSSLQSNLEERCQCLHKNSHLLLENKPSDTFLTKKTNTINSQPSTITGWEIEIPKNKRFSPRNKNSTESFGFSKPNQACSKEFISKKKIEELCKKMYKKIVLICHPDRNSQYRQGIIFKEASKYYHQKLMIGLIHCSMILEINIDFIDLNSDMVSHLISEMSLLIRFILVQPK